MATVKRFGAPERRDKKRYVSAVPTLRRFTWSLEVDASHLHGVGRVVGGNVCVVEQAFAARLQLLSFAAARPEGGAGKERGGGEDRNTDSELAESRNGNSKTELRLTHSVRP